MRIEGKIYNSTAIVGDFKSSLPGWEKGYKAVFSLCVFRTVNKTMGGICLRRQFNNPLFLSQCVGDWGSWVPQKLIKASSAMLRPSRLPQGISGKYSSMFFSLSITFPGLFQIFLQLKSLTPTYRSHLPSDAFLSYLTERDDCLPVCPGQPTGKGPGLGSEVVMQSRPLGKQ